MSLIIVLDKEEGESWDECNCGYANHVLPLQPLQCLCIVTTEDNEEDVDGHGTCPAYISQGKPI